MDYIIKLYRYLAVISIWVGSTPFIESKPYIAICAIFRDEDLFLREWIEHHRALQVDHFYLYNNLSSDTYLQILQPYIEEGIVDLVDWPVETDNQQEYLHKLQIPAYLHALHRAQEDLVDWAAFIDLDEFLNPHTYDTLPELLAEYQEYPGLAINWQLFGTSWVAKLNSGEALIEHLVLKGDPNLPLNQMVKLIVQPARVKGINNPHSFEFFNGELAVNSRKEPFPATASSQAVLCDIVQLNHYWFGPENWFFTHKLARREKWRMKISPLQVQSLIAEYNQVRDESIIRFLNKNKKEYSSENTAFSSASVPS